jgi:hypothetical protein
MKYKKLTGEDKARTVRLLDDNIKRAHEIFIEGDLNEVQYTEITMKVVTMIIMRAQIKADIVPKFAMEKE